MSMSCRNSTILTMTSLALAFSTSRMVFILSAVHLVMGSAFVLDSSPVRRLSRQSTVQLRASPSSDAPSPSSSSPSIRKSGPNLSFSPRLVQALDLAPLFEGVSRHAATKRGKDAILRLVHLADGKDNSAFRGAPRREMALAAAKAYSTARSPIQRRLEALPNPIAIVSIAQSAAEARDEYELTRQASLVLNTSTDSSKRTDDDKGTVSDIACALTLPPIYGGTSP